MPKGPQGQTRPADVIGCAVIVARITTGDLEEKLESPSEKSKNAQMGGRERANRLSKQERSEIAKKAAAARWAK